MCLSKQHPLFSLSLFLPSCSMIAVSCTFLAHVQIESRIERQDRITIRADLGSNDMDPVFFFFSGSMGT